MSATCELTAEGNLRLPADLAARWFPADACVAARDGVDLLLLPLLGAANGGLVLKQRNPAGDRSVLVSEVLDFVVSPGSYSVDWDESRGAVRVMLGDHPVRGTSDGRDASGHRSDRDARPVDGLADRDLAGRGQPHVATNLLHRVGGSSGGDDAEEVGGAQTITATAEPGGGWR